MTREEIIEAIKNDDMMPYLQDWEARDVVDFVLKNIQPSLPEGLEEAAWQYAEQEIKTWGSNEPNERKEIHDDFIAGAEYQRKQDQQIIELAEDHAMLAGMNKMKEEMMEKAVEGMVCATITGTNAISFLSPLPDELNAGDKVKVIFIKEDEI